MLIQDVQDYLRSLNGGWVDPDNTVDRFIIGDPTNQLSGIAVGWMSYTWALRAAAEAGCNLFITHEPTFFDHFDSDPQSLELPAAQEKRSFCEMSGMTILRCHDLWDKYPEIGVADSWADLMGFGTPLDGQGYYHVLDVSGRTVGEVVRQVADRTRQFGQEAVQLIGDPNRIVNRLAVGTGAATPLRHLMFDYGADMALCSDDGFTYWNDGALAIDSQFPVALIHHHVSEEYGIQLLAEHLGKQFASIPVYYIKQQSMFSLISHEPAK